VILRTDNLVKTYGGREVVQEVSVQVAQGEIVGLLGPNGAGKTTTFYMTVGFVQPDRGKVYLDDKDITQLAMYKRARLGLGYLPQEASVFRKLTVEDNLKAVLEMTTLSSKVARALASDPNFILLDEPFAGIDPIAVEDIQKIVARLKMKNIGILITDHNVQETLSIIDRAYLMFEGKILRDGSAEELAADEMVRRVYLGQNFELRKKTIDFG